MKYLKELLKEKKYVLVIIAALMAAEVFLFTFYGYHWLKTVRYLILSAFLVVLGFIDSKRTLIPNQLLIMMLAARAMLLIGGSAQSLHGGRNVWNLHLAALVLVW